ncbi:MAG: EamA family transporter [Candidatus Eisenbacteria bacterium]|nr:EamA family transporter [Candidatus Eisenbacteria bacterium]
MDTRLEGSLDARGMLLLGVVLVGLVGSQLCVKAGLERAGGVSFGGPQPLAGVLRVMAQPLFWAGLALTGMASVVWLGVLSRLSLSVAYPLLSLSYVLMLFAARWLYKEPITWPKLAGVLLVCCGVALLGRRG